MADVPRSSVEHFADGLLNGSSGDGKDTGAPPVSPPRVVIGASLISLALDRLSPLPLGLASLPFLPQRAALAASCFLVFVVGVNRCVKVLHEKGTSLRHTQPTTALVTTGPYAVSRNPAYVMVLMIPAAFAVGADSLWPLCFGVPAIVAVFHWIIIPKEEELLARKFPDEWKRYAAKVRTWL